MAIAERMPAHAHHAARDDRREPRQPHRDERPQPGAAHDGADDREGEGDEGGPRVRRHEQVEGGERGDESEGQSLATKSRNS